MSRGVRYCNMYHGSPTLNPVSSELDHLTYRMVSSHYDNDEAEMCLFFVYFACEYAVLLCSSNALRV